MRSLSSISPSFSCPRGISGDLDLVALSLSLVSLPTLRNLSMKASLLFADLGATNLSSSNSHSSLSMLAFVPTNNNGSSPGLPGGSGAGNITFGKECRTAPAECLLLKAAPDGDFRVGTADLPVDVLSPGELEAVDD